MSGYTYEATATPVQAPNPYELTYTYDPNTPYAAAGTCDASAYGAPDEIRTIFITGFPEDVKERELNNMLRFLPGYQVGRRAAAECFLCAPLCEQNCYWRI